MKMPAKITRTLVLAAGLALALASGASAQNALRWKFKEGETLDYILERAVDGKISLSGADIEFTLKMTFDTTWKVKSVGGDGSAKVEQTLDRLQVAMDSPLAGSLEFDSENPTQPDSPAWGMLEPMVDGLMGQTLTWKISPQGNVTDIELPKKLAEIFAQQAQQSNRQQAFGIGGNIFSEPGIKEFIQRSVLPLPDKAPAKDVTWKQHFENQIPRMGVQTSDTTFSFAGNESLDGKNVEKIASVTELTFEPADDAIADLEITSQKSEAAFYFDPSAGRLIKASGTQSSTMEMSGARELTQESKETSTIRMGKSPPAKKAAKEEKPAKDEKKDAKPSAK